jgi:cation transporter-like permease
VCVHDEHTAVLEMRMVVTTGSVSSGVGGALVGALLGVGCVCGVGAVCGVLLLLLLFVVVVGVVVAAVVDDVDPDSDVQLKFRH